MPFRAPFPRFVAALSVGLILATPGFCQSAPTTRAELADSSNIACERATLPSARAAEDWLQYFYLHEDTTQTTSMIRLLSCRGVLADSASQSSLSAFFAGVFRRTENLKPIVELALALPEKQRIPLAYGLWMAGSEDAAVAVSEAISWPAGRTPDFSLAAPDLLRMPIQDRAHLDLLWAAFTSTGDTRYSDRVRALALKRIDQPEEPLYAAAWDSSVANLRQHDLLLTDLVYRIKAASEPVRTRLSALLVRAYAKYRPFADRDYNFSAAIGLHQQPDWQRLWQDGLPSDMQRLPTSITARSGETLWIELFASGMSTNQAQRADVGYRIVVSDSTTSGNNASIPESTDQRPAPPLIDSGQRELVSGLIPTRFRLYRATPATTLTLPDVKTPRTLLISAVLNDRIGQHRVTTTARVEVLPALHDSRSGWD